MAIHQLALIVSKMHTSTLAELPYLAIFALVTLGPLAVTELIEAILPYTPEAVRVDVTLSVVSPHAGTSRDVAIDTN